MLKILQSGLSFAEIREDRLGTCVDCTLVINRDSKFIKCSVCGCFMQGKTMMPTAKCPEDKWKL